MPADPDDGAPMSQADILFYHGGEAKSLSGGRFAGYAVVFNSPDKSKHHDIFHATRTEYNLEPGEVKSVPVLVNHGMDPKFKRVRVGQAKLERRPLGIWAEGQLKLRAEYEAKFKDDLEDIERLLEAKALGFSTGVPGHLVSRTPMGDSSLVTEWPLDAAELSLTPTPAEPRAAAVSLKSLLESTEEASVTSFVETLNRAASVLRFARGRRDLTEAKVEAIKSLKASLGLYRDSILDPEKLQANAADVDRLLTRFK